MAKKGKAKSAKIEIEEGESGPLDSESLMVLSSSDDEAANEDLSLKIVEKALLVKASRFDEGNHGASDDRGVISVVDLAPSSSRGGTDVAGTGGVGEEADLDLKSKRSVKRKTKKTKVEKVTIVEDGDNAEMIDKVETVEQAITAKAVEPVESLDPNSVNKSDNIVLRKLLRGARYFDPPDSGWETCYTCGEEGHMAVNCKSASKRKKPCFLCGSLDHGARQCSKTCSSVAFIDLESWQTVDIAMILFSGMTIPMMISRSYSAISARVLAILCCVNFVDTDVRVSCYRCGQLGHTGLSCRSHWEITDDGSPSLCYKCGEGGHFARECTTGTPSSSLCYKCGGGHFARECSSAKVGKRNREASTPNWRPRRENREYLGYKSAPHDQGKIRKRKKIKFEENGFSRKLYTRSHWSSPKTPPAEGRKKSSSASGDSTTSSRSSKTRNSHRYSASRFSNFGNDEPRRGYNWWVQSEDGSDMEATEKRGQRHALR
ncbi:Detected protein of unknown function [Hibiscus syriacus]|uniref:CCHC-type domain-containing protein n=1 Tax=Hibiscus syriacus TaxID=106335 RepID=A0A6A2Y4L4_HIBSY|nr:Detected protein of unknown function [Hibiscus syriacus]